MGRSPCCAKEGLNRGAWTAAEDNILTDYIKIHGEGKWRHLPKRAGLKRCGKSCRLRWFNYLRPDIKRGNITRDEEDLIIRLHNLLGNRWSLIAGRLPGRTDNEIKNYWNTNIGKKLQNGNKELGSSSCLAGQDSDPDPDPEPGLKPPQKTTTSAPCLIRTKATRCTKVILNQELQSLMAASHSSTHNNNDNHIKIEAPSPFMDSEGFTNKNVLDFMVDNFEIDDNVFSDLMNMKVPSCLENEVVAMEAAAADNSRGDQQGCYHLCPHPISNNETCFINNVSDDSILHSSEDFQSMSALMENEFDWL
ncbi:hypothetical protein K1719_009239 [Acacia pycnantha]|nr:hypothetical protein K1719_009239 [Acacia pycnantha]